MKTHAEKYFTVPLHILRSCKSELTTIDAAMDCGVVSAGLGHRQRHGETDFVVMLSKHCDETKVSCIPPHRLKSLADLWQAALVGQHILGVRGHAEDMVASYIKHHQRGSVFFRIREDFMWNALNTARRSEGHDLAQEGPPLSFREFRVLAAILSAQTNKFGFAMLGWESIQARACGFKSKAEFAAGRDALPEHCQPLGRQKIRDTIDVLAGLGFFMRVRDSKGARGGRSAYSMRHATRQELVEAVRMWKAAGRAQFAAKAAASRAEDLAMFKAATETTNPPPTNNQHKEGTVSKSPTDNQHKEGGLGKQPTHNQVGNQVGNQHKEKDGKEKGIEEKDHKEGTHKGAGFVAEVWKELEETNPYLRARTA